MSDEKKCKYCAMMIPKEAKVCPHCRKKQGMGFFGALGAILLVFIIIGLFSIALTPPTSTPSVSTPASQGPSLQERLELKWDYNESNDQMGRGKINQAYVKSLNQIDFGFPYQGPQRAILRLRKHPEYGKNVIFQIERGQFLCRTDDCNILVRFGDGKPMTFAASEPADHDSTILFIQNYDRFLANTKKNNKVSIEAQFYQEGNRVFEFDVSGLKWP